RGRPGLHPGPRDDGRRLRRGRALRDPRHQRRQLPGRRRRSPFHAPQRRLADAADALALRQGPRLHRPHHQHRPGGRTAMKITEIRFGMLRVPLKTPFKTALRTVEQVEDVVVMIHTDTGHVGYGGAPATAVITGDTHGSIVDAIRHYIAPRLMGQDIANLNRITHLVQGAMEKNSSAKAAVEIAVHDLWGQLYEAPLYKLLGGGDPVITTDITISVDTIDKMVADSLKAVERGFDSLKIKVGKDIGVDIERTKAIHAAVEGRALLRLDANQGWT